MTETEEILEQIKRAPGCLAAPPTGLPAVREQERLPSDLQEFYTLCGGARLFDNGEYPMRIVGPDDFARANPEIRGGEYPDDITDYWYIVARGGEEEAISIDCNRERLGRCYDSFWDVHGVAGSCVIVALSFTELLRRLFHNRGGYPYWLVDDGPGYGDAYAWDATQSMRIEVTDLLALGPLPASEIADQNHLERLERALARIMPPVTDDEAVALATAFGPDDCFGLAWSLVHLIESAPHGPPLDRIPESDNEWIALLRERTQRAR